MDPTAPVPTPRLRPAWLRLLGPLGWVLGWFALVAALAVAGLAWLARSDEGSRWLMTHLPGIETRGWQGALLGNAWSADRLVVRVAGVEVAIDALVASGLRFHWRPDAARWLAIEADRLAAAQVAVSLYGPPSTSPPASPGSIGAPLSVEVQSLRIGRLRIVDLPPFEQVTARAAFGAIDADGRATHRLQRLAFAWDRLRLDGDASIGSGAPLPLVVDARIVPNDGAADAFDWHADARVRGPLARLEIDATLRAAAPDTPGAPSADVRATIEPFAAWPVAALAAETRALDLAALARGAPRTSLQGRIDVRSASAQEPVEAVVQLENARPGRWDAGLLPVRRLALDARGRIDQRDRVVIERFEVDLAGDPRQQAARWQGRGLWDAQALALQTTLDALRPQALDARAPAMTVGGPLGLTWRGLPAPDGAAPDGPASLTLEATLEGRLDAAPQPVRLQLAGSAAAGRIRVTTLQAQSGAAQAQATLDAVRDARGAWRLLTDGRLRDLDPVVWWPGEVAGAWRQGPHRLSGDWRLDLQLPRDAVALAPPALAQRIAGTGRVQIAESRLAGVPLALEAVLEQQPHERTAPSRLRAWVDIGGNRLEVEGQGNPLGEGGADRLRLGLRAGSLAALAPLARLHPMADDWLPRGGSAEADAEVRGRWPRLATEGQVAIRALAGGQYAVEEADLRWQLDTATERPLAVQAQAAKLRLGTQQVTRLKATLEGTPAAHRIELSAALPLQPSPAAQQLLGLDALAGTRALLRGEGRWRRAAPGDRDGGATWTGRIDRLAVGAWDGGSLDGPVPADWVEASDLEIELHAGADGGIDRLVAAPGRLKLAEALLLRWDEVRLDGLGEPRPRIELRADVETFAVAPLLARLQPAAGWGGDLRVAARLDVRARERFEAEVEIDRVGGDLVLSNDAGRQALGLETLRLALTVRDGEWTFAQAFAGRALGEMAGAATVRTDPSLRWPAADAPLQGVLQGRVADLGVWGTWLPPGWRLGGEITVGATLGGRFGAPEYEGAVRGREIAVRNVLEGVNVTQGEVAIALKGPSAQIETFSARAGDGRIELSGDAEFGARPRAALRLEAERFRLLGRVDRRVVASGSADLLLDADGVSLGGRFVVDDGLFDFGRGDAPTLDADVHVRRAGDVDEPGPVTAPPGQRRRIDLDLVVDLGSSLRLRGRGLDTGLRGQLRLSAPGGRLAINGRVATEGGTYAAYGQNLEIERGIVDFAGAPETARLDVLALRPNLDIRVGVAITGTVQTPRIRLYSEPAMSDTDRLSWLVLGREPDGLGRSDTALLQSAALALLAGEEPGPAEQLIRAIGLDDLSFRQSDGEVRETVVALGKQLSRRWYVGYERSFNAATGTFQLVYRIAQRFTLRAQSGDDNSLDLIWVWKFDRNRLPRRRSSMDRTSAS